MLAIVFLVGTAVGVVDTPVPTRWWNDAVEDSLKRAPETKGAWEQTLAMVPPEQRPAMAYLLANLPFRDLEKLPPEALLANVALAYQARAEVPWSKQVPEEIFLDAVLPHASLTEPRESSRGEFHAKYLPLVKDCKTPGDAAQLVNQHLFKDYKVTYNTRRLRTDQNSKESIAQGMATCTGLSIMLVEACRAVGVPARVAGIASWPGRGGNHTWVEIWDNGWHFAGAAEHDPKGLDHAWFVADASKAIRESPRNAIWASTYKTTGAVFPLAWNASAKVNGENVTDRYSGSPAKASHKPLLMVEVRRGGERVIADVSALDRATGSTLLSGKSLGPQADINLHLSGQTAPGESFLVVARLDGVYTCREVTVNEDTVVRLDLDKPDPEKNSAAINALLTDRFGADAAKRDVARKILSEVPFDDQARELAREAYKASPLHDGLRKEYEAKTVKTSDRASPYLWRHVGEKPKDGWALVIAMHGGGNAPKAVNDSQWKSMFERYYKDHPEAGGYVYLSLRAPNDTWNGFYDDAICPMIERLIRQFVLFGDVDSDRVYTLGASHGGYGAFVIGPKIPDRFAAVHASASAPTDGETFGENLRNTRFTFMVGERDTAHGRAERCLSFAKKVEDWRGKFGGYAGGFEWRPGVGHAVPDRDKVAEMVREGRRDPWPKQVVWVQSDDVLKHFYWVEAPNAVEGGRVEASVKDNTITVTADKQKALAFWLDSSIVDLSKPVTVTVNGGKAETFTPKANLETFCVGLDERGDPRLSAPARMELALGTKADATTVSRLPRENLLVYRGSKNEPEPVKTVDDWKKRRAEILDGMQTVMGRLPGVEKRCPLDMKVEEEVDCGKYVRMSITYASEPDSRVPAYLLIPKTLLKNDGKTAPGVLCLHGTDNTVGNGTVVGLGTRTDRSYASELAERGYVALAPNYPLLAKYQPDIKALGWQSGTLKAVWDNTRGLDLLDSLPYVKHGAYGTIGHSLGGHNSVYTAVFDDRLKAVVTSCGLDSYLDYYGGDEKNWHLEKGWCQTRYMRKLADYRGRLADIPFDFHEMIGALAPRSVLIIAPLKDGNFQWESVDRIVKAARPVYSLFGHPARLKVEHPDCDHDFPDAMRQQAYALFDAELKSDREPITGRP